jgi:predicted membrane-bound mannosyltransferase/DNA-binding beta-propeller fold protein YncE
MQSSPQTSSWFDRPVAGRSSIRWEQLAWGLLIFVAAVSRFVLLEPRVISHDEGQHVQQALALYRGEGYTPNPMTHGPFQIISVAFSYFLFGPSDLSARVPAALFGVAAVAILYLFRRWLGRAGALAAGVLMAISPYMLYYSRYVRNESFVVVWGLLMFYAVGRYLEDRRPRWLYLLAAVTALHYATKETAYIYVGLAIVFLFVLAAVQLYLHRWTGAERRGWFFFLSAMAVLLAAGGVGLAASGRAGMVEEVRQSGVVLDPEMMVHTEPLITNPAALMGLFLILLSIVALAAAIWILLRELPFSDLRERFPVVDLLVVLTTTLLPQLAALPMALFNLNPFDGDPMANLQDSNRLFATGLCVLFVLGLSVIVGLLWDRKLWPVCAGIFFGIYALLFSVCLTNLYGVLVGLVGSVNYWLAQQEVERGSQPWYYYILLQIPMYEYLPALLALSAPGVAILLRRKPAAAAIPAELVEEGGETRKRRGTLWAGLAENPILWMIGYWCASALATFTFAGEKMPWLTVHITLPFILIGGWVIGRVIEAVDWPQLLIWPRWIGLLIAPAAAAAAGAAFVLLLGKAPPFAGNTQEQLAVTGNFVFYAGVAASGLLLLAWLCRMSSTAVARMAYLGAAAILALCTVRTAWRASYIEYDNATEFLVYAHAAAGVKTAMGQIEEISRKTHDDLGIVVPYDTRSGWLLAWYLRDYPNACKYGEELINYQVACDPERSSIASITEAPVIIVADHYWNQAEILLSKTHYAFTYMRMWWPLMDYFNLDGARVRYALGSPEFRSALWQIWFNRDYAEYAQWTGNDLSLSNWPAGERMRLYVRKDIARQIWQYGSEAYTAPASVDPYAGSVLMPEAEAIWGQMGMEPGLELQHPRGIAVAPDGSIYVADTGNHRIEHYDSGGKLLHYWGSFSGADAPQAPTGTFNEPWGVAVGPDGSVYVADTWNFRIQKFSPDGTFLTAWGSFTSLDPGYQLYGPRAIAVDSAGRVFVADTGNKRIVAYDSDGNYLQDFGGLGYEPGQFDEPVGLAFGPDGRLYVADAWNRRIQVFEEIEGAFIFQNEWPIIGWEGESTDTKPYLAVSRDGRVWVTDPGGMRVLVFDLDGNFLFTFGAFGTDSSSFAMPTGIAAGSDGLIYVTDTDNNRIMVFSGL